MPKKTLLDTLVKLQVPFRPAPTNLPLQAPGAGAFAVTIGESEGHPWTLSRFLAARRFGDIAGSAISALSYTFLAGDVLLLPLLRLLRKEWAVLSVDAGDILFVDRTTEDPTTFLKVSLGWQSAQNVTHETDCSVGLFFRPPTLPSDVLALRKKLRKKDKREGSVVNLLVRRRNELEFMETAVQPSKIDNLDIFYGEGFEASFHTPLLAKLTKERTGLAFLHGPPGGGKTTYVRHLIAALVGKKRVLIVQRALVESLGQPDFIDLLVDMEKEPTVLLIEDAEDVVSIESRSMGAATGTLLNLTDGLLNDIAGVQVVCTFNCPVDKIDPALVRPGRNIGMHHFRELTAVEARKLATHMGRDPEKINGPMMLAEVLAEPPISDKPTPTKRYL